MTCSHCSTLTQPTQRFCHECGERLLPMTAAEKRKAALAQASAVAKTGARAARTGAKLAKKGLETRRGRSVAACAAIGAAAGSVVPVLGPISGSMIGAATGLFRKLGDS